LLIYLQLNSIPFRIISKELINILTIRLTYLLLRMLTEKKEVQILQKPTWDTSEQSLFNFTPVGHNDFRRNRNGQ